MVVHSETTVESIDGTTLFLQSWHPKDATAKAHVVMCHGYLEHGGRYQELAEYMAKEKIAASVFDFRGHGKSAGIRGFVKEFSHYHDDVKAVLAAVQSKDNKTPLFLLAHSNGALVAFDYLLAEAEDSIKSSWKGLIASSPFLAPANELSYVKVMLSKILGSLFPTASLPVEEVSAEVLMHDEEKRKEHDEDELNQKNFTLGWALQGMRAQTRVKEQLKTCPIPLLFVYAGDDKVADPTANKEFANGIAQEDKTVVECKDEYHEILNETNRKETFALIKDWVLKRV